MTFATTDSGRAMIADALAAAAGGYPPAIARRVAFDAEPTFIGIAGPKRSGKDTLANLLSGALRRPVDSFAAPLRELTCRVLGMTPAELEECKETPIPWLADTTPRTMMQTLGTEWGRDMVHPELWVRSLFARHQHGCIISDVRFPNEARAIRQRGGVVVRLQRPGTGAGDAHASERPLPVELVDIDLVNDESPQELLRRALAGLRAHGVI